MMTIKTFQCNMLQENAYVLSDDTNEAVIIDCGAYYDTERQAIVDYLLNQKLTPVHLLCTHGHFDHCFGNDTIFETFGLKPEVHADDEFLLRDLGEQVMNLFGSSYHRPTPPIGHFLSNNETIHFGNHQLQVLHTPGHTPGGVIFYCAEESVAFTGDTLFRMSVGRTDFERGSWKDLLNSLQTVVSKLPDKTTVYPGHGPITNIAEEKRSNPYMRF
jgi:glyoxylase-like metal-dependent hydrolase (beta-lactamase superfamily II)